MARARGHDPVSVLSLTASCQSTLGVRLASCGCHLVFVSFGRSVHGGVSKAAGRCFPGPPLQSWGSTRAHCKYCRVGARSGHSQAVLDMYDAVCCGLPPPSVVHAWSRSALALSIRAMSSACQTHAGTCHAPCIFQTR